MKILKVLYSILKDEDGGFFSGLVDLGLNLLGQKERGDVPEIKSWKGAEDIKKKLSENILGKIGAPTPYQYNPAFTTAKPAAESAAESTILGKLGNLPTAKGYSKDVSEKYKETEKSAAQEEWQKGVEQEKEMYNRLGLASSTPWLSRYGEKQGELEDVLGGIESRFNYEDIARELEAQKLTEDIATKWTTQGQLLGGAQRGYEQMAQQMTMEDLLRLLSEEQMFGGQGLSFLDMGAPTPGQTWQRNVAQWQQPNIYDQIGGAFGGGAGIADILTSILGG